MLPDRSFIKMVEEFGAIQHESESGPPYPFTVPPTAKDLAAAITKGARSMPIVYRKSYVDPLLANLNAVLELSKGDHEMMETLAGAAYQHAEPSLGLALGRFLALTSDIFRSFLSKKRRAAAGFPIVEAIPPLAMFQRSAALGPFTYTCDDIARYTGGSVGVVSLPAVYATHPLLWTTLAHETGGHDVIHSDAGLLSEMEKGAEKLFEGKPIKSSRKLQPEQKMGLIWNYWMEEASADCFAVLNMGPTFAVNAAAFCASLNSRGHLSKPLLRAESTCDPKDPSQAFETHPTDVVRLSLLAGVIDSLTGLSVERRAAYTSQLKGIEKLCSAKTTHLKLTGVIDIHAGAHVPLDETLPVEEMRQAAHKVGAFIVTTPFKALGGKCIQELETWNDFDESVAEHISELLREKEDASAYGDDAHLLAGANLAVMQHPGSYRPVIDTLEKSLDQSFLKDPYWSGLQRDHFRSHARLR